MSGHGPGTFDRFSRDVDVKITAEQQAQYDEVLNSAVAFVLDPENASFEAFKHIRGHEARIAIAVNTYLPYFAQVEAKPAKDGKPKVDAKPANPLSKNFENDLRARVAAKSSEIAAAAGVCDTRASTRKRAGRVV